MYFNKSFFLNISSCYAIFLNGVVSCVIYICHLCRIELSKLPLHHYPSFQPRKPTMFQNSTNALTLDRAHIEDDRLLQDREREWDRERERKKEPHVPLHFIYIRLPRCSYSIKYTLVNDLSFEETNLIETNEVCSLLNLNKFHINGLAFKRKLILCDAI